MFVHTLFICVHLRPLPENATVRFSRVCRRSHDDKFALELAASHLLGKFGKRLPRSMVSYNLVSSRATGPAGHP